MWGHDTTYYSNNFVFIGLERPHLGRDITTKNRKSANEQERKQHLLHLTQLIIILRKFFDAIYIFYICGWLIY